MRRRVTRIAVGQAAKVCALLYAILGLIVAPFFVFVAMTSPVETGFGPGFALALPIVYGVFGYIMTALMCAMYNIVARQVGGIEVEVSGDVG